MIEWKEHRYIEDDGTRRYVAKVAGMFDVQLIPVIGYGYAVWIGDHRVKCPPIDDVEEAKALAAATLVSLCRKALREIGARP